MVVFNVLKSFFLFKAMLTCLLFTSMKLEIVTVWQIHWFVCIGHQIHLLDFTRIPCISLLRLWTISDLWKNESARV